MNQEALSPSPAAAEPAAAPLPSLGHGWTTRRAALFIGALADFGMVSRAARSVGMSRQSAYALRARLGEGSRFAQWWDEALHEGAARRQAMRGALGRAPQLPPEQDVFGIGR